MSAKAYVKYANNGTVRFGIYRLQNPLNQYLEIGLSYDPVTDGQTQELADSEKFTVLLSDDALAKLTGYNVSINRDILFIGADSVTLYGYARIPDGRYYNINSFITVYDRNPIIDIDDITATTAQLNISNLACQVGWSGDLRNEDWFGFILLEANDTQPSINVAYDVTPASGSPDDGTSGIWTVECDLTDNLTVPFVGLSPETTYCVYVCRGIYSKINEAGDTALRYCLVGGEKGFIEFTTQAESQEEKTEIENWSWDATPDRTASYKAYMNLKPTINFKASVWNEIVEKTRELYSANKGLYVPIGTEQNEFNPNYTYKDLLDIARMDSDNDLTALRFNALRYCVGSYEFTEIGHKVAYVSKVTASDIDDLVECLRTAIRNYNFSL